MTDHSDCVEKNEPTKRKRPGRAARRRQKKETSIRQAGQLLLKERTGSPKFAEISATIISSSFPTDRSDVLPGVYERRIMLNWNLTDEMHLVQQLGYVPGNAIEIVTRAHSIPELWESEGRTPVVVQLYPLVLRNEYAGGKSNGRKFKGRTRKRLLPEREENESIVDLDGHNQVVEPFPTIFWLTHPMLRVWVSKLELEGLTSRLEERLAGDRDATRQMKLVHESYGRHRLSCLLTPADLELVQLRQWDTALGSTVGVGGTRNFNAIKCLHAHLAHFLSGKESCKSNIVGQWVMEELRTVFLSKASSDYNP